MALNKESKTIFLCGCGGSYDIYGGTPYYFKINTNRRSWIHSFQILVQDGSKILDRIDKSCLFSQESCRYNLGWPVKICLFCQESCILENQVKFLLLNQEKTLAWSPRWKRILAARPRKSRIWKERWQERRLVQILACITQQKQCLLRSLHTKDDKTL